ncbi:hypothetical protein [Halobacillus litoralis]|uniref:Uncharacterized protein n=1 Tax=Halobacillus litoralis TaxID=45668 RepID=A0A410MF63_9BACI|nr:hypothetical protein [Halobacillus litoralis]QAS53337.1 hypothetical protein HLI_14625 [Halobacillus litoralis]
MSSIEEKLKEMRNISSVCWKCKIELRGEDMISVTDRHSITIVLCHDCYEFYQEVRSTWSSEG